MPFTLICGHPSPFAPTSEWRTHLAALERRGDPEKDVGLKAAIRLAKEMIEMIEQTESARQERK